MCTKAEPCEEETILQEQLEHRAEILAVLGTGTCYIGKNSHQPPSTLSCFSLPPSASSTIPKPAWVLMPFPVTSHPLSTSPLRLSEYVFPHHEEYGFSPTPFHSPPCISFCLGHLGRYIQHPVCSVYPVLFIPSSQLPRYLALLYLSPKEPINSEHPAFSWVHSLLFNNTTPYFK